MPNLIKKYWTVSKLNPMNTEQNTFMIPIPNYVKLLKTEKLQVHWISCDLKLFL